MTYFVYLLRCSDDTFYTGITTDLTRRLAEHNEGSKGARYTKSRRPVVLVYSEEAKSRSAASKREAELRRLPRKAKQTLLDRG